MKVYDVFKEYIWLVQTIYRYKRLTFEEINKLWCETNMSGGVDIHRATFNRHRAAIEDIFGIYIDCDRLHGYKYYIGNSHVLEEDSVQNWLLSTLSVNNIISESLSVQDRIQIESIPDDRFLSDIIEAMKKSRKIEIMYRRFGADDAKQHIFSPYALKVYNKRWYVLAFFDARVKENGEERPAHFTIFSFDRIESVKMLDEKFKIAPDFSLKEYFRDSYGIVNGDKTPAEKVIIRAYGREAYNMRSLPIHQSQKETVITDEYSDFELYLKPTLDFSGKLLSRGAWIEVIEPQWLRDDIAKTYKEALDRYR